MPPGASSVVDEDLMSQSSHPIIALWTVPRSVSTTFERMMVERGDMTVISEPFLRSYYYGPDRRSARYGEVDPAASAEAVLGQIEEAAERGPVFVKDMAYQAATLLGPDLLARFHNCFLVRDPAATLRSLARHWPDFTEEETGWHHLDRAATLVEDLGQELVVLDSEVLCADPAGVVQQWCRRTGLDYRPEALHWEPGMLPAWTDWADWHASTSSSTGFEPLRPSPPPTADEGRVYAAYERALPVYRRLTAHALGR